MPYVSADAVALLQQVVSELAELRRLVLDQRRGVRIGADVALLHVIFAVTGYREFTARELIQMAARPGVPEAALRGLLGERSPRQVGKLLAPIVGTPSADTGLVLTATPGRCGNTWRVSNTRTPAPR
jgi:hypothetical protein